MDEKPSQLWRRQRVLEFVDISNATLHAWIHTQGFPPPIKIGRSSRWRASAVQSWIEQQAGRA